MRYRLCWALGWKLPQVLRPLLLEPVQQPEPMVQRLELLPLPLPPQEPQQGRSPQVYPQQVRFGHGPTDSAHPRPGPSPAHKTEGIVS